MCLYSSFQTQTNLMQPTQSRDVRNRNIYDDLLSQQQLCVTCFCLSFQGIYSTLTSYIISYAQCAAVSLELINKLSLHTVLRQQEPPSITSPFHDSDLWTPVLDAVRHF